MAYEDTPIRFIVGRRELHPQFTRSTLRARAPSASGWCASTAFGPTRRLVASRIRLARARAAVQKKTKCAVWPMIELRTAGAYHTL